MTAFKKICLSLLFFSCFHIKAQLVITPHTGAASLAQKLVGDGVLISNVTFTGRDPMAGFFNNLSGTKLGIDSGIVLTNGRAKSISPGSGNTGVDGDGITQASSKLADNGYGLAGDHDLALEIGAADDDLEDACILEFDFVPLGDSIKFRYVFSSEEYTPAYVCTYNDAFAFFISGPGFPALTNIALVPNTTTPVSIFNVNNVPGGACPNNTLYYWDNAANKYFTHDGHTTVLTALAKVTPCQRYHLKLVISDVGDDEFDSGVFLEAKSLTSNILKINNLTQTDGNGNSYLVEGCVTGSIKIKRPQPDPSPLIINLSYGGTVQNGVDIQPLPSSVTIPANQTEVTVNLLPIIDNIPEGIETLKIYALAGCATGIPTDSAMIQLRDYDILGIAPDSILICKNSSVALTASAGYNNYQWDPNATLSNTSIRNPVAMPVNSETTYYCTANIGTCQARDSSFVKWRELLLDDKSDIFCKNGNNGSISVHAVGFPAALTFYSINNGPQQATGDFNNLPAGHYVIKVENGTVSCVDSVVVNLVQAFPDISMSTGIIPATCTGNPDGILTVTPAGGNSSYTFSIDGINFQPSNTFNLLTGNYTVTVKDGNGCNIANPVFIPFNNTVTVDAGSDPTICESKSVMLQAVATADQLTWSPATGLSNTTISNPVASPVTTTKYYLKAVTGICEKTDSVTVWVNAAPVPDAGQNASICYGQDIQLHAGNAVTYLWYPSYLLSNNRIADPVAKKLPGSATYFLNVVDANGCASLKPGQVTITVSRPAKVAAGNDTAIAMRQPLQLFAKDVYGAGFVNYSWSPVYGLNDPSIASPVAVIDHDTRYIVTARNAIGCESSDTINVKAYKGPDLYVPNAFTPNGDGLNDVLHIIPIGTRQLLSFKIFDRWGKLVFLTSDQSRGWDGRSAGGLTAVSTYTWIAEGIDYNGNYITRKGMVTLIK